MVLVRGAMDRRWSVICRDQSPRFGTHVIHGLTDKFNHHRVKVYHLHVFRDSCSVFCARPLPHTHWSTRMQRERERERVREREWERESEREREARFRYRVSDNASTDRYIHTHTQNYVKIPVLASILVNTVTQLLCLKLTYTAEKERAEQLCFLHDNLPFLNWENWELSVKDG